MSAIIGEPLFEMDWAPLHLVLEDPEKAKSFMYMATYQLEGNGVKVHTFKNAITRRYLNVDSSGQCYRFVPIEGWSLGAGEYVPICRPQAIAWAFS